MSGLLGPLLLKCCRVWGWFLPKTFQGLHFLFSGSLSWSIYIWAICPWNKFDEKAQCGTALILMSFLLHLSLTLCTFEPSTYNISNIHERPSSCLESNLVKSLLIVGGKLLIVGNTKCHLEHDFKVFHFSWSLCNRHCWACKIWNWRATWWYNLLLKCHLAASFGTRFEW